MNERLKKQLILNLPYVIFALFLTKVPQGFRLSQGETLNEKFFYIGDGFSLAFENYLPSFHSGDLIGGIGIAIMIKLLIYIKGKEAKKYRQGVEYGSARWGNSKDIAPFTNPVFEDNVILTQTESLTMGKPTSPKVARNKNVLIVGGSGSGKTRFWLKPNLMQLHSSLVITDPNGI